jgi:hypothetical protein
MNVGTAFCVMNLILIDFPGFASRAQKKSVPSASSEPETVERAIWYKYF